MSMSEIVTVLDKAIEDESYRTLLFSGSGKAVEKYKLTDSERSMLMRIGSDSYTSAKRGLVKMKKMFADAQKFKCD